VLANRQKAGVAEAFAALEQWASSHRVQVITNGRRGDSSDPFGGEKRERLREIFAGADLVVTLGGDGTLLYGAQVVAPLAIPVLSVSLGSLGFHTQVDPAQLTQALDSVLAGEFLVQNRLLLQASIGEQKPGIPALALNDVVVAKSAWGHMVHLRLHVNAQPVSDISADGLLVASPTGSSAYNYAAGGPVVFPTVEALVLNAICPHRLNFSPVVVPADVELEVLFQEGKNQDEAQVLLDGQQWGTLQREETLKISRAPMYLPLIIMHQNFFSKLRDKLRWGGLL